MNEKVLALLWKYDEHLASFGVSTVKVNDRAPGPQATLGHARWMIQEMLARGPGWSERKVNRWLGFVHGILWCHGGIGIVGLRDDSRHLYDD